MFISTYLEANRYLLLLTKVFTYLYFVSHTAVPHMCTVKSLYTHHTLEGEVKWLTK